MIRELWGDFRLYGDKGFPITGNVITPFRGVLTYEENLFNYKMSAVRQAVENYFGISKNTFRLFQQPKSLKVLESAVGANYLVSCHILNILTILRGGNQISSYFNCPPPSLHTYLNNF